MAPTNMNHKTYIKSWVLFVTLKRSKEGLYALVVRMI